MIVFYRAMAKKYTYNIGLFISHVAHFRWLAGAIYPPFSP